MQIKEIMTGHVEVIPPSATLQEAGAIMNELNVGPLPVCDGDQVLGMITDRDLTIRATAEGADPTTTEVREVMTPDVITIYEDQEDQEAAQLMQQHQIRRLLVVNRDQQLVGIVSLGDLAVESSDDTLKGETLEEISEPSEPMQ